MKRSEEGSIEKTKRLSGKGDNLRVLGNGVKKRGETTKKLVRKRKQRKVERERKMRKGGRGWRMRGRETRE